MSRPRCCCCCFDLKTDAEPAAATLAALVEPIKGSEYKGVKMPPTPHPPLPAASSASLFVLRRRRGRRSTRLTAALCGKAEWLQASTASPRFLASPSHSDWRSVLNPDAAARPAERGRRSTHCLDCRQMVELPPPELVRLVSIQASDSLHLLAGSGGNKLD